MRQHDPHSSPEGVAPQRRQGIRRWLRIGCLSTIVLVAIALTAMWVVKPWAPKVVVADPGPGGTRVTEQGLIANYYPGAERAPGILVLGGSEGGLSPYVDEQARQLHDAGYSTLALSYFAAPGQPPAMESLPLETFDTALAYLAAQPHVDPARLGVIGTSKGGEAALLVASRHPDLASVVGMVPSSVVWQGLDQQRPWRMSSIGSTWSHQGVDLPYLPYGEYSPGADLVELYRDGLTALAAHHQAVIPIEKSKAAVLLVCGGADTLWPSCDMSNQVLSRAQAAGGPTVSVLSYPEAGHFAAGPPVDVTSEFYSRLDMFGGTPESNQAAREQGWPKVLAHLDRTLRGPVG
ncbi:acyl-CoA thioester hydrolase/BAAT C-terminal domain-containing protein [Gephyromycinifex aptenodytis]|uniref:acyl-CoA thioester hydrolase/BAAT C-terminal domain-containing protein n=1 Tax=Gephyromycinifex aptenodytis TaxID=2716227 RepID=UPI001447CC17|nr:acyl-CoA thioester hydrolase/BAAT C-terminal domain-containing protein [Gephyromycinifex aptenodytis]